MTRWLESTQQLGRALMLPIAVLPVAGLLLRLGQPDLLDLAPLAAAGDAVFSNLGLLFAIGIAVGLARENHGAAGLAGAVAYFVAAKGAEVLITVPPEVLGALAGPAKELAAQGFEVQGLATGVQPVAAHQFGGPDPGMRAYGFAHQRPSSFELRSASLASRSANLANISL